MQPVSQAPKLHDQELCSMKALKRAPVRALVDVPNQSCSFSRLRCTLPLQFWSRWSCFSRCSGIVGVSSVGAGKGLVADNAADIDLLPVDVVGNRRACVCRGEEQMLHVLLQS